MMKIMKIYYLNIITRNYLSIDSTFKEKLFFSQLKFIFSKSEELWIKYSFLLKSLIELIARIVRIDYLKNPNYQKVVECTILNKVMNFSNYSQLVEFTLCALLFFMSYKMALVQTEIRAY